MVLKMKQEYTLNLSREEFALITKALVQRLSEKDVEPAKQLGLAIMDAKCEILAEQCDAAEHARGMAKK